MCSFIPYWVGLQKSELEAQDIQDAKTIKTVALFFHRKDLEKQVQDERQMVLFVC
jgi:hypothetical protein